RLTRRSSHCPLRRAQGGRNANSRPRDGRNIEAVQNGLDIVRGCPMQHAVHKYLSALEAGDAERAAALFVPDVGCSHLSWVACRYATTSIKSAALPAGPS